MIPPPRTLPRFTTAYVLRDQPVAPSRRVGQNRHGQWWVTIQSPGCRVTHAGPFTSEASARIVLATVS